MPMMYINEGEDWLEAYRKRKPQPFWKKIKGRTFLAVGLGMGAFLYWLANNLPLWLGGLDIGVKLF
jgi:hypothetical protein